MRNLEEAVELLNQANKNVTIKQPKKFWLEVENQYLRQAFPSQYFTVKYIVIERKTKKGIKQFDYIYYYEIVTREKTESELRKDNGHQNNNYTKSRYVGKVEDFERLHGDSFMNTLVRNGRIEYGRKELKIHSTLLAKLFRRFPTLIEEPMMQHLLNQIEEEIANGSTI